MSRTEAPCVDGPYHRTDDVGKKALKAYLEEVSENKPKESELEKRAQAVCIECPELEICTQALLTSDFYQFRVAAAMSPAEQNKFRVRIGRTKTTTGHAATEAKKRKLRSEASRDKLDVQLGDKAERARNFTILSSEDKKLFNSNVVVRSAERSLDSGTEPLKCSCCDKNIVNVVKYPERGRYRKIDFYNHKNPRVGEKTIKTALAGDKPYENLEWVEERSVILHEACLEPFGVDLNGEDPQVVQQSTFSNKRRAKKPHVTLNVFKREELIRLLSAKAKGI